MGAEKFHLAVTIDRERLVNRRLLDVLLLQNRSAANKSDRPFLGARPAFACPIARRLQFNCHVRRLKLRLMSDFRPPAYVSTLLAL
jgi:hypothetical protein